MFTLFYGLYKHVFRKEDYFVLILGLDNAGKTTYLEAAKSKLIKGYKGLKPERITSTVGQNVGTITYSGIKMNFWDLGGQEELQPLWEKYYAESHAIIYVVDSADRERMTESKDVFDRMISSPNLSGVPLLVLANKQDIPSCMGVREVRPVFSQSAEHIGRRDCMVMPVSALTGAGVDEGLQWLVECIKRNSEVRPPHNQEDT